MMTRTRSLVAFMFLLALVLTATGPVFAEDDPVGFSVDAVLPDNQINSDVTYFDHRVEPGAEQNLLVNIHNHEQEELTVRLDVFNASTNSNGLIVYEEGETDPSLSEPLTELLTFSQKEVKVPGGATETVAATLQVPEEPFDGIRLGGLHFEKAADKDGKAEGVRIENRYAYVIGIQLSESDEAAEPALEFGRVEPGLVNQRTAVTAGLRNTSPVLLSGLSVHARVMDKDGEVVREKKQEDIRMAPNSKMDVVIDWENRPLEPGTYQVAMSATLGDHEWNWKESFMIERAQARDINRDAVELEGEDTPAWMSVGISVLAVVVVLLLMYIRRLKSRVSASSDNRKEG